MLITSGVSGIGGNVVKLLAEKGTKILVLDVILMTFEAPYVFPPPPAFPRTVLPCCLNSI